MATLADKLDIIESNIMSGLKDFQRATVNRIAELYRNGQMRVLVSDEVGLGKTLIARGTVAKLANIRKSEGDKLVKVVYICSNIAIADQNLNKLRISSEVRKENAGYLLCFDVYILSEGIYFDECTDKKREKFFLQNLSQCLNYTI